MHMKLENFSLRERNRAEIRFKITQAFIAVLAENDFESLTVSEVCAQADVSRRTFFNHFPQKVDVLLYRATLLNMEIMWNLKKRFADRGFREQLFAVTEFLGQFVEKNPNCFSMYAHTRFSDPVRSFAANLPGRLISPAEKVKFFPECEGIEEVSTCSYRDYYGQIVKNAMLAGEVPLSQNLEKIIDTIGTILYGVPIVNAGVKGASLVDEYLRLMDFFWFTITKEQTSDRSQNSEC